MARTPQKKNPALAKHIGLTIAKYRLAAGLTQDQVAEQLDIGLEAVSRLERGVVMPTVERLVELAEVLHCQVADLLMQSSQRVEDQSVHLHQLLSKVDLADRTLIMRWVEEWVERLKK